MSDKARGFWQEFKSFAVKGNAFDLAVAVVIGNAFSAVVNSFVADVVTPLLGLVTNHVDLKELSASPYPGLIVKYGSVLQALLNFFIIAFSIFVIFKLISVTRRRIFTDGDTTPPAEKPAQERLLQEIRDLLKERNSASL